MCGALFGTSKLAAAFFFMAITAVIRRNVQRVVAFFLISTIPLKSCLLDDDALLLITRCSSDLKQFQFIRAHLHRITLERPCDCYPVTCVVRNSLSDDADCPSRKRRFLRELGMFNQRTEDNVNEQPIERNG